MKDDTPGQFAFSPRGDRLAVAYSNRVVVHQTSTGAVVRDLPAKPDTTGRLRHVRWSADGKWIAASRDDCVHLWDAGSGAARPSIEGHPESIYGLSFAPDSKLLATACTDGKVRLWNPLTGRETRALGDGKGWTTTVEFSPDGSLLTWTTERGVMAWATDGKSPARSLASGEESVLGVAFAPDGKSCALGLWDGEIQLLEAATGKRLRRWRAHLSMADSLGYSPDGKTLYSGSVNEGGLRRWEAATGRAIDPDEGHRASVDLVRFSPDGRELWTFAKDNRLVRWDLARGTPRAAAAPLRVVRGVYDLSADGRWLACANRAMDHRAITLHDAATGKLVHTLAGHADGEAGPVVSGLAVSPDGERLASCGQDGTLRLWRTADGKQLAWLDDKFPKVDGRRLDAALRFSPDGRLLLCSAGEGELLLYDVAAGKRIRRDPWGVVTPGLVFLPDGDRAALFGMAEGRPWVAVWNVRTGTVERSWEVPEGFPLALAVSPDGRLLAGCGEGGVRLWDAWAGEEVALFRDPRAVHRCLAFSPDGRALATGADDSSLVLWDVTGRRGRPGEPLSAAERSALWGQLAGDAKAAHAAVWRLALSPGGPALLREHLAPAKTVDLAKLIDQLGADDYAARVEATKRLEALGGAAVPSLRRALAARPDLEARRRAEAILKHYERSAERRRELRAVAALEYAGTPAARAMLEQLSRGAADAPLTEAARRAVRRVSAH